MMTQQPMQPSTKPAFSSKDWDGLCASLKNNLLLRTELSKVAKELGLKWPIKGKDETAERYIRFTLDELAEMPEFFGKGNRLSLLYSILTEIKRMDDPYAEMDQHLGHVDSEKAEADGALRKLGVPDTFPVELINFSKRTRGICKEGGYETLGQLIDFLKTSASAAIINEEFREFMGYLVQMDTSALARLLPIREGSKGIHLAEGLGLLARRLMDDQAATLLYAYKISTTRPDWGEDAVMSKADAQGLIQDAQRSARKYLQLLPEQALELKAAVDSGVTSSVRYFVSLNDPDIEAISLAIAMAALERKPRFKGLMGNFLSSKQQQP